MATAPAVIELLPYFGSLGNLGRSQLLVTAVVPKKSRAEAPPKQLTN
ncbi:hypothetical protein [Nostoc sp.]